MVTRFGSLGKLRKIYPSPLRSKPRISEVETTDYMDSTDGSSLLRTLGHGCGFKGIGSPPPVADHDIQVRAQAAILLLPN